MNWTAIAAIAAGASAAINALVLFRIAFAAGKVVQQVEDHERRIIDLEAPRKGLRQFQST